MAKVQRTGRRRNFRSTPQRKITFAAGLLFAMLGAICFSFAPSAQAATTAQPITDYANYPVFNPSLFPAGCATDGPGILTGVTYTLVRGDADPQTVPMDDSFKFQVGDVVTMTWTGYAPNCAGVGISLAVKKTDHPTFVISDNQTLVSFAYCSGTDCGPDDTGSLTMTIPPPQDACNFQFDAVIGPPLQVVGPDGSYYGSNLRSQAGKPNPSGPNMLIGFSNGGRTACQFPTATVVVSCTSVSGGPGAIVTVTNPDATEATTVDVTKNGTLVSGGNNVPVAAGGGTADVPVPLAQGETASIDIIDNSNGQSIVDWPQDIAGPTNCDEETTTTTTIPTTTTTVEVQGSTTVPDSVLGEELARTGSSSTSMMTIWAGLLIAIGGFMMALANWSAPTAAHSRSRGR